MLDILDILGWLGGNTPCTHHPRAVHTRSSLGLHGAATRTTPALHLAPHQDDVEEPIVDEEEFEALFLTKPAKSAAAPQLARGTSTGAGGSTLSLLDPKHANNLSIILSRSKLSFEQMRKAVLELNAEARARTPTATPTRSLAQPSPLPQHPALSPTLSPHQALPADALCALLKCVPSQAGLEL